MSDIILLRNMIQDSALEVYACNPKTYKELENDPTNFPSNWLIYPNEMCPEGELQQANLTDESLKKFLFEVVLPRSGFMKGQKNIQL